jgi:hypothetical protein
MKQEIPKFYGQISRKAAIRYEAALYRAAKRLVDSVTSWHHRIEILRLVLSVLTSGGIWILLRSLPQIAAWFGAVFSTILSGLASYQFTLGPKRKVKQAYALLRDIGRELAALRGHPEFDRIQFWERYESFEFQLKKLENPAVNI